MKTYLLLAVIILCTTAICLTTASRPSSPVACQWEYQTVNANLGDGKWLANFGKDRWEFVGAYRDTPADTQLKVVFKRPK